MATNWTRQLYTLVKDDKAENIQLDSVWRDEIGNNAKLIEGYI